MADDDGEEGAEGGEGQRVHEGETLQERRVRAMAQEGDEKGVERHARENEQGVRGLLEISVDLY